MNLQYSEQSVYADPDVQWVTFGPPEIAASHFRIKEQIVGGWQPCPNPNGTEGGESLVDSDAVTTKNIAVRRPRQPVTRKE